MIEGNEYYLPMAGDTQRHAFYEAALNAAIKENRTASAEPVVLDCSSDAGIPSLVAARNHGLKAVTLTQRNEFAKLLRQVAADNNVTDFVEAYAADPRDFMETLLPTGEKVDIVAIDPPGTPLQGLSPFAVLPTIKKKLLKEGGSVAPARACLLVGLVESVDMGEMFSVPNNSRWQEINLTVWNHEARRNGILERLTPYTKWFGRFSTMEYRWLSKPRCAWNVNFNDYYGVHGNSTPPEEEKYEQALSVETDGRAHAIVARWEAWATADKSSPSLGAESDYFGRSLTWPHFVQAITVPGLEDSHHIEPVPVKAGEQWVLDVTVLQGTGKVTGMAGPEFSLRLGKNEGMQPHQGGVEL